MKTLYSFLLLLSICILNTAQAQNKTKLSDQAEGYQKAFPTEKLYLSFDKSYYNAGDTLWFKSFLLNGDLSRNTRSDKIYVELFNDSLKFIENRVIALNNGLGYGDFALTNNLREGSYVIRAYSNWQQNFGSDYFFQKSFYIGNAGEKTWLLNAYQKLNTTTDKKTLDLKLRLTNLKNEPAGLKDVEIVLMNDRKTIMKADLQTSLDGVLETKIPLGDTKITGSFRLVIIDKKERTRQSTLPIILQEMDQVDLQFMPEGGFMVNNINGKVGFKAVGADGLAKAVNGNIVDGKNQVVTAFATTHNGMGSINLLPRKGENYFAIFNLAGKPQKIQLPSAKDEGTTLRIDALSKPDSVFIYIKASQESRLENYQLLAQAANETIVSASVSLLNGISVIKLTKQIFPDGIIHFTLISPAQQPINERQVFINRKQKINLAIKPDRNIHGVKDRISVDITATKEDGKPLSGTFAIAVTDDGQVKQTDKENIASYFLLKSDLKGKVEDAGWYFKDEEPSTLLALDDLLLTQGWIGYQWDEITKKDLTPNFIAEKGNSIEGNLTALLGVPAPNIKLTLMSLGKSIFVTDTISNAAGQFKFIDLPYLDSTAYTIKIKNAKGKTALANIFVNEFVPAKDIMAMERITPWYVNSDSTTLRYYKTAIKTKKPLTPAQLALEGTTLNEVEIIGQTKLKNFILKTAWDAKFMKEITEEELKKTPRKTLLDLLKEKINGFTTGSFYADGTFGDAARPKRHNFINYMIGGYLVSHVMIDGVNTHLVADGADDQIDFVAYQANKAGVSRTAIFPEVFETNKYIFNTLSAEDIVNISIYKGASNYYLDIKTRSGKGPWIVTTPGAYVFRPLPVYRAKDFYMPKYSASSLPDYRSTIFWDANVVTDEKGKAKISFYAADKPTTYSIKIEGTDLNGRFGFQKSNITITDSSSQ